MEIILFAAMGECGTRYPGWWRPRPKRGEIGLPLDPIPVRPIDIFSNVLAIAAGIGVGILFRSYYPTEALVTSALAAFAGGRIASDLLQGIGAMRK